ncbi:MAG TPA: HD domain-containing phosphohydrolase [Treponemataceae bacterium]|nr:HD domain-containing phosphohydrolase [Treponemataceae bacterium]
MSKRLFVRSLFSLCFVLLAGFAAADDALVTRYMTAANNEYSNGNHAKAFSYVNIVLNSYKEDSVPHNVEVIAETIYFAYLEQIKNTKNTAAFNQVKEKLIEFPYLSTERINRLVKVINTQEAQDIAWGSDINAPVASGDDAAYPSNNPVLYNTLQLQLEMEKARQESEERDREEQEKIRKELAETQQNAFDRAFRQASEASGQTTRVFLLVALVIGAVLFIVFVVVIINLVVNMKSAKTQHEKFVETLKVVSQLSRLPAAASGIEALPPAYGSESPLRMIGNASISTGLPPAPETAEEKAEFDELTRKCREVGLEIDQATGRKNNAKNVAEMIYKISQEMGLGHFESMLFFNVGQVYDVGFLEVNKNLFGKENLTEDEIFEIRNHVKQGLAQISFVPEKYMSIFADGVLMHHENMDGSGYPEGLSENRIPYIARVIRIAESYIALISRRNYRDIYDKESAVEELRKKPGLYDSDIVTVLETII